MGKSLFIAEKPSVGIEFCKALGMSISGKKDGYIESDQYIVTWCIGHLITMSYPERYGEQYKSWTMETLPFIPQKYKYEVIDSVKKQYKIVTSLLNRKDISKIYYSGDSAREGEYIQRLVRAYGGHNKDAGEYRVWIDSQTKEEILNGIRNAKPLSYYDNLADSAYARAIEDYLVGMNFSRALSLKYAQMVSNASGGKYRAIAVGRVMSCVLGMIVERERSIRDTKTFPYYGISAQITSEIKTDWTIDGNSPYKHSPLNYNDIGLTDKKQVEQIIGDLNKKGTLHIDKVKTGETKKAAPLLFNLAELQSECTKRFHISPSDTLKIAQKLYEAKMTTYPRTDARVLTTAISKVYEKNIRGIGGMSELIPFVDHILSCGLHTALASKKTKYIDDAQVSDHYAIIPTGEAIASFDTLSDVEQKVYLLICKRFLAIFYPETVYSNVTIEASSDDNLFTGKLTGVKEPGYQEVSGIEKKGVNAKTLEDAKALSGTVPSEFRIKEGMTKPPARYTTGSMILAMENAGNLIEDPELREQIKGSGIGTSATRADIITKLEKNGYITVNKKTQIITPAMLGELIYDVLHEAIPNILNPKYTASWEQGLSGITEGKVTKDLYLSKIDSYITNGVNSIKNSDYSEQVRIAINRLKEVYPNIKMVSSSHATDTDKVCPICGRPMKENTRSIFCTGYRDGCKFSVWKSLPSGQAIPDKCMEILLDVHDVGGGQYESEETPTIKGIKSKSGKNFDAKLKMTYSNTDGGKLRYVFEDRS